LAELTRLTQQLALADHVTFAGALAGDEVYACYDRSHLGVSALAIHRKGLHEAAALKAREYCAAGIPFLASGHDPDFAPDLAFRIEVSSSEDTASLIEAFRDFGRRRALVSDGEIRRYAVETLDFSHKLESILT
jgi:glycosyltransferase involved in cell wall biosynthesis